MTGTTRNGAVECTVPVETAQVLATAAAPTTGLNAGNDRIAASVERAGTTIDLGEAQGSDPLSTTARALLDDVQLPPGAHRLPLRRGRCAADPRAAGGSVGAGLGAGRHRDGVEGVQHRGHCAVFLP